MGVTLVKKPPGTATVVKKLTDNKGKATIAETTTEEKVALIGADGQAAWIPAKAICEVGFEASYTKNLGDYQSARVGVSLKVPCAAAEVDDVFAYATDWVNVKLGKIIEEL